ncbi:hypothetical protein CHISP_1359 [Chitinispirillum alkaliphilum]|nr:hypothetical protein CHISP_1359 [Chitinispirillum alkaliphilum]
MENSDKLTLKKLIESFTRQLSLYSELRDNVRGLMSRLVLSRGDVSGLVGGLEAKTRLLEEIQKERSSVAREIDLWQSRKELYSGSSEADQLEELLGEMERVIKEFLDGEDKLKGYLEKLYKKNNGDG